MERQRALPNLLPDPRFSLVSRLTPHSFSFLFLFFKSDGEISEVAPGRSVAALSARIRLMQRELGMAPHRSYSAAAQSRPSARVFDHSYLP